MICKADILVATLNQSTSASAPVDFCQLASANWGEEVYRKSLKRINGHPNYRM